MEQRHEPSAGSALWLPLFDELSDPVAVARLAAEAEEVGWQGVFVWDHLRWQAPVRQVADPWITLAAIAVATERVRLGPMVTPLPRRRPAKVARETATIDRLSKRPLVLGAGIGGDRFGGELSATGEQLDDRLRGQMLDESLQVLTAAWSGQPVQHHGLAEIVATIVELRRHTTAAYDIAVALPVGVDPLPYVTAGATWWLPEFPPEEVSLDKVRGVMRDGPLAP